MNLLKTSNWIEEGEIDNLLFVCVYTPEAGEQEEGRQRSQESFVLCVTRQYCVVFFCRYSLEIAWSLSIYPAILSCQIIGLSPCFGRCFGGTPIYKTVF